MVGTHLVGKAKSAAFLLEVEDDATARLIKAAEREPQLIAAIAAARPNTSPVRQAECKRTGTGRDMSGLPTITAVELPPMASRKSRSASTSRR